MDCSNEMKLESLNYTMDVCPGMNMDIEYGYCQDLLSKGKVTKLPRRKGSFNEYVTWNIKWIAMQYYNKMKK